MSLAWPMVPLREVLQLQRRWIKLHPTGTYREIGIRSFGNGIFHKTPIQGSTLGNKRVLRIEPGDLVFNNVFAWEGAVAVAGPDEAGMIGSHRFVTYTVNPEKATAEFLQRYFNTNAGREILLKASPGSAGRNKTLGLDRFITQSIPLPPVTEQKRLVEWIDTLAAKIEEAKRLRAEADEERQALIASFTNAVFESVQNTWPVRALGELADIRSGVTLGRAITGPTIRLPYLRVANVQDGRLDLRVMKEVEVKPDEAEKWTLESGDLLLTEGGDWDKLGRGTVWRNEIPNCIHQNHIFRVRVNPEVILPDFLAIVTGSPYGKSYFQSASKQTTNLASINQRQLKAFPTFVPSIEGQQQLIRKVQRISARLESVKEGQSGLGAQLDAMLPIILDRAFRGELE